MKAEYDFSQAKRGAVIPQTGKTRITIKKNFAQQNRAIAHVFILHQLLR